jgi:hypothetical protein
VNFPESEKKRIAVLRQSLIIAMILLVASCKTGRDKGKPDVREIINTEAPGVLFNGIDLEGWEITNFGPQGPVYVSGGRIILEMGDGCTGITWKKDFPADNYEVSLQAMRVTGNDFFCGMTFPVGEYYCTLVAGGWGGTVVGISSINGLDASENETKTLKTFDRERWYSIKLRVVGGRISAWIDDENVVDFEIGDNYLSTRAEVELSKPFGIASWVTTAALRDIKVTLVE